jgi:fibronectin type 3 domain-containing protein
VWRGTRRDGTDARRLNAAPVIVFLRDDGGAVEAATSFFTDTLPPSDSVYYWLEGIDAFGRVSRRSAPAPFAWRVVAALAAPPLVQARVQGDTVLVSWLAPPDTAVTAYQVWRAERDTGPFVRIGEPVRAPAVSLRDPGRPARALSWYRVTALDRTGRVSDPSPVALAEVPDLTPPAVPDSLAGRADTGRLALRWRAVAARDLRGYRVYRAATADGTFGLLTPQPRREPAFVDSIPRRADHPFYYRVTAVDSAFNESAPSAVLAVRPPDVTAPSAPRIATVRALDAALAVTWLPNPEPDVVAYRVRYRGRDDAGWLEVPVATPAAVLSDTIPGLAPGRPYDVSLVAVDDAGNRSAPAPLVPGTPVRRRAPDSPDLRRAAYDGKSGGAVLEWARPAADVAAVVVLRRQGDQAWRPIAELPGTATRFVDRLARHGQRYEYQVRVRDAFGNVAESRARRVVMPEAAR